MAMRSLARCGRALGIVIAVAMLCVPFAAAQAAVLLFSGGPTVSAEGASQITVPPGAPSFDDYAVSSIGFDFMDGFTSASVSDSTSLGGGTVTAAGNASYTMTLGFDGLGSPSAGSILLNAASSLLLSSGVATGPDDWAFTRTRPSAHATFLIGVTDVPYLFSMSGDLLDETRNSGARDQPAALFFLVDDTTGSIMLFFDSDTTPRDGESTHFAHQVMLQPDHEYRMVLSAHPDFVCAQTSGTPAPVCEEIEFFSLGPDDAGVTQSAAASLDFTFAPVPEPVSACLVAAGLAALGIRARRRA
jgi:hypothetical protein